MQFAQPFDARTVEPSSFAPPPPLADYHVLIVESEAKQNSSQTGGYLEFTLCIKDPGPYMDRHVPYRLNLYHQNAQTVEIAYKQLSALCHVTNVFQIQDSRQLHNIPFIATIGPQKDDPRYSNVFDVKDLNGNRPGKQSQGAPVAVPAAAPPWTAAPAAPAPAPAPAQPPWGAPAQPPAAAPPTQAWQPPAPQAPAPAAAAPWGAPPQAAPTAPAWQPGAAAAPAPPWAQK